MTSKIFISHATEDKETVATPLAELLIKRGLVVWLDQWELTVGDRLRSAIEHALSQASFGIVILSPNYLRKQWPIRELDGLFSLETIDRKLILPVLHNIRHDEITSRWPMLSDRLSCSTDRGLAVVADQIVVAVNKATTIGAIVQPPEAILSECRRRMFLAANGRDLQQLLYELDDFLRSYPAHPQARILKDELAAALRYESSKDDLCSEDLRQYSRRYWTTRVTCILLFVALLVYGFYRLMRYFFG